LSLIDTLYCAYSLPPGSLEQFVKLWLWFPLLTSQEFFRTIFDFLPAVQGSKALEERVSPAPFHDYYARKSHLAVQVLSLIHRSTYRRIQL